MPCASKGQVAVKSGRQRATRRPRRDRAVRVAGTPWDALRHDPTGRTGSWAVPHPAAGRFRVRHNRSALARSAARRHPRATSWLAAVRSPRRCWLNEHQQRPSYLVQHASLMPYSAHERMAECPGKRRAAGALPRAWCLGMEQTRRVHAGDCLCFASFWLEIPVKLACLRTVSPFGTMVASRDRASPARPRRLVQQIDDRLRDGEAAGRT